ncbi:putative callose synthase 8 isoform X2 [Magnolia sinica]|uniref:putative callose synthase 8 isoform X2 n=1 Tax=Magnolia sinica TaxID=86752 RepID=UPI00265A1922|nr:putative callose synthase 8 isoform X2 [Magnolia sinica]
MMEIVPADSSHVRNRNSLRPLSRARTAGYVPQPFDSEKLPQTLINIRDFLRVANEIESESPRAAYLCRFHAFERAHSEDSTSSGRGVRQFKTSLLKRLEQDENATLLMRKEKSDARELKCLYQKYADIFKHGGESASASREQLMSLYVIASVLLEVWKTVTSEAGLEKLASGEDIEEKPELYVPYNILPLDPGGAQQAIMQLPEIKAAVAAVQNIRGLPLAENHQKPRAFLDLLDWLRYWFGFQEGNVVNQREHLILLLANIHVRQIPKPASMSKLDERAVDELMKKVFKNYKHWCKFLGRKNNLWLPSVKQEVQQYKILYTGLYLLIWGEASNLRLMPECLCYIFHHMAYELFGVLSGAVSLVTGEKILPEYRGGSESFLYSVVTPIYDVVKKEAERNRSGTAEHSKWRNYDDLNEFFWSPDCFQLGWPMRLDHNFFITSECKDGHTANAKDTKDEDRGRKWLGKTNFEEIRSFWHRFRSFDRMWAGSRDTEDEDFERKWLGKTNFVEIRSFWHLFRSFDRMWTFFILALQVLIIMAWHGLGSLFQFVDATIFEDIMSIFITSAILRLVQVTFDIIFTWKARHSMHFSQILRYIMKLVTAATWTIILPIYYVDSRRNSSCSTKRFRSGVGEWCFSSYMATVAIYLLSNAVGMVLFFIPAISSHIETSNWRICSILSWWAQPQQYVGRGMQERQVSVLKYTFFWGLLLFSKFSFSYHFQLKPLVEPTKQIMRIGVSKYEWHELFPKVKSNAGAIVAVWAPIIIVYFMDTQIWYSIFCTLFGGVYGMFHHLGEIRTMGMLRSRFQSLPSAFNVRLIPPSSRKEHETNVSSFLQKKIRKVSEIGKNSAAKFAQVWNQIISSFRSEDLISNREMDLLTIPLSSELSAGSIRWPVFLLATKLSTALDMARDFVGKDEHLYRKIKKDDYTYDAVVECYESLKNILDFLVMGELEKRIMADIIYAVEESMNRSSLLVDFKMSELPVLCENCIELVKLLFENKEAHKDKVVRLLQDVFEVVTKDMMINGSRILNLISCSHPLEGDAAISLGKHDPKHPDSCVPKHEPELFSSSDGICFPLPNTDQLKQQMKRLLLLLTTKETAMDIPVNLEARRRISFFATSLLMDMPAAPKVRNMLSFSVLTPYYMEEVNFSKDELHSSQDWVPIIFYMQTIYPDEWKNFLERMGCDSWNEHNVEELRNWASFRGQTLSRTVRGMMYYRKALKLQAFLDMAEDEDILESYKGIEGEHDRKNSQLSLSAQQDALADLKFTYVISCQMLGAQKASGDSRAKDILELMIKYPSVRVAYIEEKEELGGDKKVKKVYSSILIKAMNKLEQEIYRVRLPGPPFIGEGKPENQNQAIIFTRGDALQTIDMNQDNYMEEAFKMRNVLQEFLRHHAERPPTIIGLREHIFTGSVSSLAGFMSYQETSFVTIGQRLLADPLRVRFHYGHPDLFDRVFHLTRGGISKASKTINLSEDVFAGFNSTLRRGYITYREYMQVGKGRDVGLNQVTKFEAKVANGNSEQTLSRDIYRLGRRFDFLRMLSCYFTTVGFYFNTLISVLGVYIFLYGQLYLILSGLEKALLTEARMQDIKSLETVLASQSFIQLGLLTGLPMLMEIGLEKGFRTALSDFILMQMQLAAVFFTFSLGTKCHYYGRTILHGGAKYRPTGRKFVVFHASFTENYRLYSRSHFVKGFELMLLLIIYNSFRQSHQNSMNNVLAAYSIWFMVGTWLFAPFLFNPSGFEWQKVVEDWKDWNKWIKNQGGIGVQQNKSWESWWNEEQTHLKHSGLGARIVEILLSIRFFIYQYGLVYHLDISQENKNFLVYVLSWVVIGTIFLIVKIAQAVRPRIEKFGLWDSVQVLSQAYDYGMGLLLFAPLAALSWLPVISDFQTRFLFNPAFNRHLQIETILPGKHKQM